MSAVLVRRRVLAAVAGSGLAAGVLVAVTPTAALAAPKADTSYSFKSAAGDYIGQGESETYRAPAATISVSGTAEYLTVNVNPGSGGWSVELAAPRGEKLHPGVYRDAERAAFRTGRSPGLDVSGNGRGCNEVYGKFTIDQIKTTKSGSISVLDAHFTQNCERADAPALTGTVHYQAYPLSYKFVSDPGDYIGGGLTKSYTNSTSVFELSGTTSGIRFRVSGKRDDWSVELAPPAGEKLHVGKYQDAQRAAFREPGHPGLDADGNGRGCNTLTGSFAITQLVADSAGKVKALAATFEQHCEGGTPALRGTIHYYA